MKIALFAALLASCFPTAVMAAADVLQPSGPWQIDYAASACTAVRAYGAGSEPLYLALVPAPTFASTQITIVRKGSLDFPKQHDVTINGPSASMRATTMDYPATKARKIISRIALTPAQYKELAVDGPMSIRFEGFDRRFQLQNVAAVQRELDKCVADLDEQWQSDTEQHRVKTAAEPLMPLGRYFSSTDYPWQAVREHNTGTVGVRMMIDETGKIQNCMTLETSGNAILDAVACVVLNERAKFHPALDSAGKPVKSVLDQRVTWKID